MCNTQPAQRRSTFGWSPEAGVVFCNGVPERTLHGHALPRMHQCVVAHSCGGESFVHFAVYMQAALQPCACNGRPRRGLCACSSPGQK